MSARERTSRDGLTSALLAGLPVRGPLTPFLLTYQDDFETPGISPLSARPRKHKRQTPNLRRNARGRPQIWQRLCWRLENLGFLFALAILDVLAIVSFTRLLSSLPERKLFSKLETRYFLLRCGPERHAHVLQQRTCLVVVARRGHDRDVHSPHLLDLRVIDFREDQLVAHAQREIAASIERLGRHAAEVTHAGQSNVHQPVEELVHTVAAQGHHHTDGISFAHLELRDRFLRLGDDRLLPGDLGHLAGRRIDHFGVLRRFAHTHVDHDLVQLRGRHGVLQAEFLHQRRQHFLVIFLAHAGRCAIVRLRPRRLAGRLLSAYFFLRRLGLLALGLSASLGGRRALLFLLALLVCHFLLHLSHGFGCRTGS